MTTTTIEQLQQLTAKIEQLRQLTAGPIWDGNLLSKTERDRLVAAGFVERVEGWNFLSAKGVEICVTLRLLNENISIAERLLRPATKPPGFA